MRLPGLLGVTAAFASPLAPVLTVSGASPPVTFSVTSTFGTRRPPAVSTSTVASAARPATSFAAGSLTCTLYGPAQRSASLTTLA